MYKLTFVYQISFFYGFILSNKTTYLFTGGYSKETTFGYILNNKTTIRTGDS